MLHKKFLMESHNAEVAKMKKNMQQIISASFWVNDWRMHVFEFWLDDINLS